MLWGLPYVMKDHHLLLSSQTTSDILMNNCIRKEGERRPPERMIQYNKHNIMWDRTNSSQSQSRFIVAILCWICQHELSFWFCSSMNGWVSVQNQGCDFLIWHEQIFFFNPSECALWLRFNWHSLVNHPELQPRQLPVQFKHVLEKLYIISRAFIKTKVVQEKSSLL